MGIGGFLSFMAFPADLLCGPTELLRLFVAPMKAGSAPDRPALCLPYSRAVWRHSRTPAQALIRAPSSLLIGGSRHSTRTFRLPTQAADYYILLRACTKSVRAHCLDKEDHPQHLITSAGLGVLLLVPGHSLQVPKSLRLPLGRHPSDIKVTEQPLHWLKTKVDTGG